MGGRRRRSRAEYTDGWEQIELLCEWPEQRNYELIRPLVLFGDPVAGRAKVTGTSERTLYRRTSAFDREDMESRPRDRLASVARPRLFRTPYAMAQPKLFGLDKAGWLKALKLGEYAARKPRQPESLQGAPLPGRVLKTPWSSGAAPEALHVELSNR